MCTCKMFADGVFCDCITVLISIVAVLKQILMKIVLNICRTSVFYSYVSIRIKNLSHVI